MISQSPTSPITTVVMTKPKRPLSAYNLFFKEQRQEIKKNQQDQSSSSGFTGLTKTVAARWNALDEQSKKPYEEAARLEKMQYKKSVNEWKKHKRSLVRQNNKSVAGVPGRRRSSASTSLSSNIFDTDISLVAAENEPPCHVSNDPKPVSMMGTSASSLLETTVLFEEDHPCPPFLSESARAKLKQGLDQLAQRLGNEGVERFLELFNNDEEGG